MSHLPQLVELLENKWFKHFIATWLKELDDSRTAVSEFPLKDMFMIITLLQTRGESCALGRVTKLAYETYNKLVEKQKQYERERDDPSAVGTDYGEPGGDI